MPFPFNRLPWGNQNRLRDLMTPSELYQMQLALGGTQNGLGQLQRCRITDERCRLYRLKFCYEGSSKTFIDERTAQNISKLVYYMDANYLDKNEVTIIEHLFVDASILETESEVPRLIHPHTILNIKLIFIGLQCDTLEYDGSALKKLASLCSKECRGLICWTKALEPDVNMPLIFTLFPNLNKLHIYVDNTDTWLEDLLEIKVTGLEYLVIFLSKPGDEDAMFSQLNVESLYKLCKAQPPNFLLTLSFYIKGNHADSSVWNFLKPYFRKAQDENESIQLIIKEENFEHRLLACYA
uniref:FTH domain-containing protein n=1 Tax=Panagrellus redivivus TaxID=6233 RepID=A0A7E4UXR6_PANRE